MAVLRRAAREPLKNKKTLGGEETLSLTRSAKAGRFEPGGRLRRGKEEIFVVSFLLAIPTKLGCSEAGADPSKSWKVSLTLSSVTSSFAKSSDKIELTLIFQLTERVVTFSGGRWI